jgi:hypothetical protein
MLVAIVKWGKSASLCRVVRAVVFTAWQLHWPSAAVLFGQLLTQQGGEIQFWILPCFSWDGLGDPAHASLQEVCLLPHPLSQPLCLPGLLLAASNFSEWLACHPTPTLSLCCHICLLRVWSWEFGSLPHSCSEGQVQCSTPTSAVGVRLQFTVYVFQFCCGGAHSSQGLCWIMFLGSG